MKAELDPVSKLSYGYWYCPECKSEFFGPSTTFHEPGCSLNTPGRNDFSKLTYRYTELELSEFLAGYGLMPACIRKMLLEGET